MLLYIARHGLATPKDEDPDCPLSEVGRRDVSRVASFLARSRPTIKRIIHSGKTRAAQTALIYAETLGPGRIVQETTEGLGPLDSTEPMIRVIRDWNDDTMLVSHLPLVAKLAARLVNGNEHQDFLEFQPGTVICLRKPNKPKNWPLTWVVSPDLLGG